MAALNDLLPTRIALIKPSALGDIAHTLPVVTGLRHRFPQAHITWVVNQLYEPILRNHPHLDEVLPFDRNCTRRGWWKGMRGFTGFLGEIRRRRFDLVIDLQGLLRTGLMALASRAPVRVGLASAREGARWFYTHRVEDRLIAHAVDRYWAAAETLGCSGPPEFHLPVDEIHRSWSQNQLQDLPRPILAVGVGSRWLTKRWPPGHFARLAQKALNHFSGSVIFVGAPDEQELAQEAARLVQGPVRNFTGTTNLVQLVALLAEADVVLANDTGPLHLAVALGRPVLAPYTCTKAARTGPYGPLGRAVESLVWCQGSYQKTCSRLECMTELGPERLWPALQELYHQILTAKR